MNRVELAEWEKNLLIGKLHAQVEGLRELCAEKDRKLAGRWSRFLDLSKDAQLSVLMEGINRLEAEVRGLQKEVRERERNANERVALRVAS